MNRRPDLLELTSRIVAAYASNHTVAQEDLSGLLRKVYQTLQALEGAPDLPATTRQPAVPVESSVMPDYIICLEDGKRLKMLKRYLRTHFDMSPDEYREKWGLQPDYPMVAPNYAMVRSEHAKEIGLGRKRR